MMWPVIQEFGGNMKATERFSDRVEAYVKYRPSYPEAVIDELERACNLTSSSVVADVGSGTGKLSELFLRNGNPVYGVEPNDAMRGAAERLLEPYPNFTSVPGTAEGTTLERESADFVTAGQAFHWFDVQSARAEFGRILQPGGWVVLVWNSREREGAPFLEGYEAVLRRFAPDYAAVNHQDNAGREAVAEFFAPQEAYRFTCKNVQTFDYEGLRGRALSSSYVPLAGHAQHEAFLGALLELFDAHEQNGAVEFLYTTEVFYGRL